MNRPLVSDQVFATLLEALLTGRYAAGEKLPTQRALAGDLGVTMTALRESLKRLEQMGLIDVRHGDAMRVRDWREYGGLDVIAHLLLRGGGVDRGILADVFEARRAMLETVASLAAQRRDDEQADRLQELAHAFEQAAGDGAAQQIDFAFFTELAQAAGNVVYVLIMNSIRALYFEHAALLAIVARKDELAPLYFAAAQAVADSDGPAAAAAVGELADRHRERVEELLA